jgi:hypothetical protein
MTHLHCPSCGKLLKIDSIGRFTLKWSTQKCMDCEAELSIRYDPGATFVRFHKKAKGLTDKLNTVA